MGCPLIYLEECEFYFEEEPTGVIMEVLWTLDATCDELEEE
jgi:hypothetical protein